MPTTSTTTSTRNCALLALYAAVAFVCLVGLAVLGGLSPFRSATVPIHEPSPHIETMSHATYFTCVYPHSNRGGTEMASASSDVICESGPLVVGSLRSGSSAAQARAEAEASGYEIPPNYVAEPANNGQGWVFRAPGTAGNADIVRVSEANAQNPTGYVRYYNSNGQPLNWAGNTGPDSETHLPLRSDGGGTEDPFGDDFIDLGFTGPLGGIIYL